MIGIEGDMKDMKEVEEEEEEVDGTIILPAPPPHTFHPHTFHQEVEDGTIIMIIVKIMIGHQEDGKIMIGQIQREVLM